MKNKFVQLLRPDFIIWLLAILLLPSFIINAQKIPSPAEFLGYEPGEEFTLHHKVVGYFQAVAEASDEVKLLQYGESYEGRPLYVAFVSTAANIERLEDIRLSNLRRTGLESGSPDDNQPAIVWLSYNVHGNESSSTEAAMKTLHHLANPVNAESKGWLENVIVIMDPCINPDGRDRYVNYFKQYKQSPLSSEEFSMSHEEEWPGGRINHYLFDLNRDWLWLSQQESQQRLALYNDWLPQIHVDFHEQGANSPYYFAPGAEPYHSVITPWQREFQKIIGQNHATYFDRNNWVYFTGEVFDLLYPSYGDTYPTFNGAIGMTYEQAGGGGAGLSIKTEYGDTLTLADRIAHHFTTGISTVEISARHHGRLLAEFSNYFDTPSGGRYKNYVIRTEGNEDKVARLVKLLDHHHIRYGKTTSRQKINGYDYASDQNTSYTPVSVDLVIPVDQPKGRLVQAMFEPETFVADTVTYDITAWSLPHAFGLSAFATEAGINLDLEYIPAVNDFEKPANTPYGYLLSYTSLDDGLYLGTLLKNNVNVGVLHKLTSFNGTYFPPGSLVILRANNRFHPNLDDTIARISRSLHRKPVPVYSGMATSGIDLGSGNISRIAPVKVAIAAGSGTYPNRVGEVWHFFERQLNYPITLLRKDDLSERMLDQFDVIFLPDGNYADQEETIISFISNGGKVIALGNSLKLFASSDEFKLQELKENVDADSLSLSNYGMQERESVSSYIPGAIFRVKIDTTHPLAYGFKGDYETLTIGTDSYILPHGDQVAVFGKDPLPLNGFAGSLALENIGGRLVLGMESYGRGKVVYFGDNPLFRSFWDQGKLLIINAVFQEN